MRILPRIRFFWDQAGALVHESARHSPEESARHRFFILQKAILSLGAVAFAPFLLAFSGVPGPLAILAFVCLAAPLAAVFYLHRTGRIFEAQALCIVALTGFVCASSLNGAMPAALVLAAFIILPVETALVFSPALTFAASLAALLGAVMTVTASPALQSGYSLAQSFGAALLIAYAASLAAFAGWVKDATRARELNEAENYRLLAETTGDVVLRIDAGGAVLGVNSGSDISFTLGAREFAGRGLFERIHVADRPVFLKAISDADRASSPVSATFRLRCGAIASAHGNFDEPLFATAEMRARRFARDSEGAGQSGGAAVVAILRNVTATRRHEEELEAARAEAERASAWKDRFLANVSHELRTPLNAIIGFSEMLGNPEYAPKDVEKQREYARIIHASGEHLLSVVNTILDMSKIEAGSFELEPEPFEIAPLVDMCCDMMRLKAEQGGVALLRHVPEKLEEIVGDKRACKQILINLLSNAVKFTPEKGKVSVSVQAEGNSILLSVADTGIGIMSSDLGRLGDPFFQARATYDRPYEGTGLGLSVVRGLVGLHGGTIRVESAPAEGTRVTIRLPLDCRKAKSIQGAGAKIEILARRASRSESFSDNSKTVKKIA